LRKDVVADMAGGVGGHWHGWFKGSRPWLAKPKTSEERESEGELAWTLCTAGEGLSRRAPWLAAMDLAGAHG